MAPRRFVAMSIKKRSTNDTTSRRRSSGVASAQIPDMSRTNATASSSVGISTAVAWRICSSISYWASL